jgi:benzoyl-CoA reductase/2-hydroxyglutaryl-CoA dehydratase subunit BcrC/BadD/HgdB
MPDDCKQEPMIRIMADRQASMDEKLDRLVTVLEEITAQRIEIRHLSDELTNHHSWLKKHELRIQAVEKTPVAEHCATLKDHERRLQAQERKADQGRAVEELESRVDELEKQPGKSAGKALWVAYGAAMATGGSVISGVLVFWLVN